MATPTAASSGRHLVPVLLVAAVVGLSSTLPVAFAAQGSNPPKLSPTQLAAGEALYRTYCGQCHALKVAFAAGFGSGTGLGTYGGPSFNNLRVPFSLCVLSLTETFAGHEAIFNELTWNQVEQVSRYVAAVTARHAVLAKPVYD